MPFAWERLQPALNGPLDAAFLAALKRTVKAIGDRGMKMKEPYDNKGTWPANAQAAIDGVRAVDSDTLILMAGEHFSSTRAWPEINGNLLKQIKDPAGMRYEDDFYFDRDSSGTYKDSYTEEMSKAGANAGAGVNIGVARLKPFVKWLKDNHGKGYIGEFGAPASDTDDPRWIKAFDNATAYIKANDLPCTVWAAGTA